MNIILRNEMIKDHYEVENLIREAFWNYYTPACADHYLVHIMRECETFIPSLDIVAVDTDADDKIVGSSMCVKSHIKGDDGCKYDIVTLGPIGVLPEYQNRGIGALLLDRSKVIAKELGYKAIVLCGDPDYYRRHEFVPAEQYLIRNSDNMFMDGLQVCQLENETISGMSGIYIENPVYNIDEDKVKEFDTNFPTKEIISGIKMQKRFEQLAGKVRPAVLK